ncbi:methyl-accepting chemotaxis protein [Cohnella xylanilytica]|uniref:methyl-accepting chemotaxis protein n=1 Tax=Cohnella xylanilytica TaxID=557555 RepID=UPI001BB42D34|nr:methyl-accepting chemotaxis protein [Cohnella xylanilytica]
MLRLSFYTLALSVAVHLLHRVWNIFGDSMHGGGMEAGAAASAFALNALLAAPPLAWAAAWLFFRGREDHRFVPPLVVLAMTLASISTIAGGGGRVEFHFSIFLVVAAAAYYENVKLIGGMTALFAVQHVAGFLFVPELVFGVHRYSFTMLVVHAAFLVLTSGATSLQIVSKRRITRELEAAKRAEEEHAELLLETIRGLSGDLEGVSEAVAGQSEAYAASNREMLDSFRQEAAGLEERSESLRRLDGDLREINRMIRLSAESFSELDAKSAESEAAVRHNRDNLEPLFGQIRTAAGTIDAAEESMRRLYESSRLIAGMTDAIREVASQTALLSLNASIEAARAGEEGRGFGIVAGEIRKLADHAARAADEIADRAATIERESLESVSRIEAGKQAAARSVELAESAVTGLDRMDLAVSETVGVVAALRESVSVIEERSRGMGEEMSLLSAATEESAASVERLLDVCRNQSDEFARVVGELLRLKELANELLRQFADGGQAPAAGAAPPDGHSFAS